MHETTIECPSCNRRIRVPLKLPFSKINIFSTLDEPPPFPDSKEYDVRDVLWVNEELAKENERLRDYIRRLEMLINN